MIVDAAVRLAVGEGLVARRANAILVLPAGSDGEGGLLRRFLDAPADEQVDAVTEFAEEADGPLPSFVCVSWSRRVRVVVYGDVELVSDHPSLPMISGAGSGTWVERTLSKINDGIRLHICCAEGTALGWTNLVEGVVAAGGASVVLGPVGPGGDVAAAPAVDEDTVTAPIAQPFGTVATMSQPVEPLTAMHERLEEPSVPTEPPVPSAPVQPAAPVRTSDVLDDVFAAAPPQAPPPVPPMRSSADLLADDLLGGVRPTTRGEPAPPASPPVPLDEELTFVPAAKPDVAELARAHAADHGAGGRPTVEASICEQCGTPNPTTASRCQVCDALMPPTSETRFVPRPALGRIVFDDEATELLDVGLLLGRNPRSEETLEECRVVKLSGEKLSRLHAEVQLRNWDVFVVDRGSTNGTFVVPYADAAPLRLEPEVMHRIEPGALVFLGTCAFRLESRRSEEARH